MQAHLVDDLAYKEQFYWWHKLRRQRLLRLLADCLRPDTRVLEIGCGTGASLRTLAPRCGLAVGLDVDIRAVIYWHDLTAVCANALGPLPFADGAFDVVVLMDVLEHLTDTGAVIAEIGRVLRPGGRAVVMVPADPRLWSYWDEMVGHHRRYQPQTLAAEFGPGWTSYRIEYQFAWMYLPVRLYRFLKQHSGITSDHSDFIQLHPLLNSLLVAIGWCEERLQRAVQLPIGTTLSGVWLKTEEDRKP